MKGIHGLGGIPRNFANLDECKATCTKENQCIAIDWETSSTGNTCWMISPYNTFPTAPPGVITHYTVDRRCSS